VRQESHLGVPTILINSIPEQIDFLRKKLPELPWQADTEEATVAMIRMAETYGAKPWEMAQGLIDNVAFK